MCLLTLVILCNLLQKNVFAFLDGYKHGRTHYLTIHGSPVMKGILGYTGDPEILFIYEKLHMNTCLEGLYGSLKMVFQNCFFLSPELFLFRAMIFGIRETSDESNNCY